MKKLGLTGNICAGKSQVEKILEAKRNDKTLADLLG